MTNGKEQNERQGLCDLFVKAATVSEDGTHIKVGKQEAEYKWRFVYGLKAQWEGHIPHCQTPKKRFYPLNFDKDDRRGVIEYLASKEADRVLEERAAKKAPKGRSPV